MRHVLVAALGVSVLACGGNDEGTPDAPSNVTCPPTGRYLPIATGNSWTYMVTDVGSGETENKTQTVGPREDVGGAKAGTMAHRLTTTRMGGMVTSWQEDTGTAVVRHREIDAAGGQMTDEVYTPHKLRIDETAEHTVGGAMWNVAYQEAVTNSQTGMTVTIAKNEQWSVLAVDDVITVGAGSFCALKVRKVSATGASNADKTYWFARGVGKIREEGTEQIEVLTAYTVQ